MRQNSLLILLTLVLISCGTDGQHFKIEGRFRNMNQGEFYLYSLDGSINGVDTIKVEGGKLAYKMECQRPSTLLMIFPNFSEQPIFAEPGASVKIEADVSHLKELTVKGTKENKLMNGFREAIINTSPPETKRFATQFIKDHPESAVSAFLVRKYFISSDKPDYKQADSLMNIILEKQPKNISIIRLQKQIKELAKTEKNEKLPTINAYDIKGNRVTNSTLSGKVAVVSVWASWNYESQEMQRMLKRFHKPNGNKVNLLSICVDPWRKQCNETVKRDSITWPVICDGQMIETPILHQLGLYNVPDNVIIKNGRIAERGLNTSDLIRYLERIN